MSVYVQMQRVQRYARDKKLRAAVDAACEALTEALNNGSGLGDDEVAIVRDLLDACAVHIPPDDVR